MLSHIVVVRWTSHFSRLAEISSWIRFGAFYEHFISDCFFVLSCVFHSVYAISTCNTHTRPLPFHSPLFAFTSPVVRSVHCTGNFLKMFIFLSLSRSCPLLLVACLLRVKFRFFIFQSKNRKSFIWCLTAAALSLAIKWIGCVCVYACVTWGRLFSLHLALRSQCEWKPFMMQLKQLRLPSIFNHPNRQKLKFDLFQQQYLLMMARLFYAHLFAVINTKGIV